MVARPQSFQPSPRRGDSLCKAVVTIGLTCLMFAGDWLHAEPVAAIPPEQAPFETVSVPMEVSKNHAPDNTSLQREFSSVIKEAVRPVYQDITNSGFVEAIRSIESDLGLSNKRPFGAESGAYAENSGSEPHRESAAWATPGNNAATTSRPRSAEEIERDQIMAKVMLKELVEEVKPWVLVLIGLYAVGYAIKLLWDYRRWKMARRRKRTSSGHRRRQTGHHSISPTPDRDRATARTAPASVAKN